MLFRSLTSSVIGAQFGTRLGIYISAEKLRAFLALMIIIVVARLAAGFFIEPQNLFEIVNITEK